MNDPKKLEHALRERDLSINNLTGKLGPRFYQQIEQELKDHGISLYNSNYVRDNIGPFLRDLFTYTFVTEVPEEQKPSYVLTKDQQNAWEKISRWLDREPIGDSKDDNFFVLKGYPGTGKTFLLRLIKDQYPNLTIFFSAPTNKASKVLSDSVGTKVRTTFSVLGLRMQHDEDQMYLDYSADTPYFSKKSLLVVDETGMVGRELYKFIKKIVEDHNIKVLFVGDPAQLNPVKEKRSLSWKSTKNKDNRAQLKQPVRFDSQLFQLSMRIRKHMVDKDWTSPIKDDHDEKGGVYVLNSFREFKKKINSFNSPQDFVDNKVVAWRNKTVHKYNKMIREGFGFREIYEPEDIILLAEPIEEDGQLIAHTDDEFVVREVDDDYEIKVDDDYVPVYRLRVEGDQNLHLNVPMDTSMIQKVLGRKANFARKQTNKAKRRDAWNDFWETRAKFHHVRHGYALTAHRIQGSTVKTVFVDQHDILANPEKLEAFRALNVACTRPTTSLYTY